MTITNVVTVGLFSFLAEKMARDSKEKQIRDFLDKVMKQLEKDWKADKHNREAAIEDLEFANPGDPKQWSPEALKARGEGRPYLTINLFPQYINQITGDIRHNRPRAKVVPDSSDADIHMARIREGIISDSEYNSNSDYIYIEAGEMMTTCGYGAWRINTRYTDGNPFIQEFYDELIENPFTVIMDSRAKCPVYSDAKHCFIISKLPRKEFQELYHDATAQPESILKGNKGVANELWWDSENITVAEYFKIDTESKQMCQMEDGSVISREEADKLIESYKKLVSAVSSAGLQSTPTDAVAPSSTANQPVETPQPMPVPPQLPPEPKILQEKEAKVPVVKHYKLTATDILSENGLDGEKFPGKYIPVVLITGKRTNLEGKRYISGVVRNAKDAARYVNYSYTTVAETIALQPRAPFMGTPKQFEGFENDYATANTQNLPFLKYNPDVADNGQIVPPPNRMSPGNAPAALFQQLSTSLALFDSAIGMNKTDLGAAGPERTGAAINARQRPGDIRTFFYIDNLARGIQHGAKIKNEMIPEIFDTKRDARLRHADDTESYVPLNTTVGEAAATIRSNPARYRGLNPLGITRAIQTVGPDVKFNDINKGSYRVEVVVGPSYATQRQEAAEMMMRLTQSMPQKMGIGLDLLIKKMGFQDCDALAERIKKTLPPGIAKPTPGEPPTPPMPPSPQAQLVMSKAQTEKIKQQKEALKAKVEMIRMLKEVKEGEKDVKKQILDTLAELYANEHPADKMIEQPGDNWPPQ